MNNWIDPTVKHVWNDAIHGLQKLLGASLKDNSLTLGLIQPSSPTTKELHGLALGNFLFTTTQT